MSRMNFLSSYCKGISWITPEIVSVTFSVLEETISQDGKSAVVKLQLHHEGSSEAKNVHLVKHQGKWKVDVDKL